jgi:hypothetical protein
MSFNDEAPNTPGYYEVPLKDQLLTGISKVKRELYPLIAKSSGLNESAKDAEKSILKAWNYLESAAETIKARANDNIPPIQRKFR